MEQEQHKAATGKKSKALSSKRSLFFHDVPPELWRRVANRYTVGHLKYTADVTMNLNWREGLDDPQYIVDRLNHMFQHMVDFIDKGDEEDDNLAGVVWGAAFLMEVERMHPELLKQVIGQSRFSGEEARKFREFIKKEQQA